MRPLLVLALTTFALSSALAEGDITASVTLRDSSVIKGKHAHVSALMNLPVFCFA